MKELTQTLVSVIVPIHQAEKTLVRCVQSIQQQGHQNLDILLIENGSTDCSFSICTALAQTDARITAVQIDEANVSRARNWGLEHARGEYLCFADADDYLDSTFVETLLDGILCEAAALSVVGYWTNEKPRAKAGERMILTQEQAQCTLFREDGYKGFVWNKLFLTRLIQESTPIRFWEEIAYCEDLLFVFDYLQRTERVVYTPKECYHYAVYTESTVFSSSLEKRVTALNAYEQILAALARKPTVAYQYALVGRAEICRGLVPLLINPAGRDPMLWKRVRTQLWQGVRPILCLKEGISLRAKLLGLLAGISPRSYCWLVKIREGRRMNKSCQCDTF